MVRLAAEMKSEREQILRELDALLQKQLHMTNWSSPNELAEYEHRMQRIKEVMALLRGEDNADEAGLTL